MTPEIIPKDDQSRAGSVQEPDLTTARKALSGARYKFGFANVLYSGEEAAMLPIHTVIVRALGGGALHLGICTSVATVSQLGGWLGPFFLKKYNSSRKAMFAGLAGGALLAFLICSILLLGSQGAAITYLLWAYLTLVFLLTIFSGIQWNIETSWIGDLVPQPIRGWFTSVKYIAGILGAIVISLTFGGLVDAGRSLTTYAGLFAIISLSHVVAIFLISSIKDCAPGTTNFLLSGNRHERLNYGSPPLWCYISFFVLWTSGRLAMTAFATAYLLDYFNYTMTQIVLLLLVQKVVSIVLLLVMGKTSDKYGTRIPLMLISGFASLNMMLWVSSAWWGIVPIIAYQFVNGAAGHTHSMLAINYGLEIFPSKGRANYFGFSNILIGTFAMISPIVAGKFMSESEGFRTVLWGTEITHYHVFFLFCALISFCSILPLMVAGKRTVPDQQ